MTLEYPSEWRFEGVGFGISDEAFAEFSDLIDKIASGSGNQQAVYERFKSHFGNSVWSSDASWAVSDTHHAMSNQKHNAAEFINAYWSAISSLESNKVKVPNLQFINRILQKHNIPLLIEPPNLRPVDHVVVVNNSKAADSENLGMTKYKLGKKIGEGGFGQVYHAVRNTEFAEFHVAIKILNPSAFVADKDKALARFKREIKALQTLQHRAIVPYLDAGRDADGHPFLVMPFIEGKNIRDAVRRPDPILAINLMINVLEGLRYAHSKDVLHRDLKPSNIIVRDSDRQAVVVDFGAAHLLEEMAEATLTTSLVGSLGYIPHEVIENPKHRRVTHDIYSCGIILYEIITGRKPNLVDYQPLASLDDKLESVDLIVSRATAPIQRRYQTTDDFIEALSNLSML